MLLYWLNYSKLWGDVKILYRLLLLGAQYLNCNGQGFVHHRKMSLNQLHFGHSFYTCRAPPLEREKPFADQEQESLGFFWQ